MLQAIRELATTRTERDGGDIPLRAFRITPESASERTMQLFKRRDNQRKAVVIAMSKLTRTREERNAVYSHLFRRKINSTWDLTVGEAHALLIYAYPTRGDYRLDPEFSDMIIEIVNQTQERSDFDGL